MKSQFSINEIKGQSIALQFFETYLRKPETIPPLLILHGPDGVGKWSTAERFCFQLLCMEGTGCMNCQSCKLFLIQQHPDYIQFPVDSKIPIGQDEKEPAEFTIRWLIKKRIQYQPHLSKYRIVLFPDASLINQEAETSLLKTLEEPPSHTRFIFIVDDLLKLKQTIISRGITIPFQFLNRSLVKELSDTLQLPSDVYLGGSLHPLNVPNEVLDIMETQIRESIGDSYRMLELELWLKNYKERHPEWEENFDYQELLESFFLLLIHQYYISEIKNKYEILEIIYEHKEIIHRKTPGLEPFLLSNLFSKLSKFD
ncbi:MAG: hypothetical protein H7A24_11450 [Leptospiraceae bacterium]|nr:hypothetical protein [Leptospiraceae bacterium]MCP5512489.1 hypothetical protein [Leptospiraceae bacterium]